MYTIGCTSSAAGYVKGAHMDYSQELNPFHPVV